MTIGERIIARTKVDAAFKKKMLDLMYKRFAKTDPKSDFGKKLQRAIIALENIRTVAKKKSKKKR
jgi:hypothetical protein